MFAVRGGGGRGAAARGGGGKAVQELPRAVFFFALIKIIREVSKQDENLSNIEDSTGRRCAGWRSTEAAPAD